MSKRLISQKIRGGAALLLVLWFSLIVQDAHAAIIGCTDGSSPISCADPNAFRCTDDDGVSCSSAGFNQFSGIDWICPFGIPGCGAAAVPEMEDYAAAAFLVLALTIGWQVRRRQQMIG